MKKLRWALIGCGKVVLKNKYTPFINRKNKIVAICTTNIEHSLMAKNKLKLKNCGCYDNIYDMIKNEKIDIIYICTPPKYHYLYLNLLCKYKIPVYVEKPFTLNRKEAQYIVKKYQKNKIYLFIAHYKRLTPKIQKLKLLVNQKNIGNILTVEGIFNRHFDENLLNHSWIYNKCISGGGRFFDISPHILDTMYYIFGDINNIKSTVKFEKIKHNCEKHVQTSFKIKNISCNLVFDLDAKYDKDIITITSDKYIIQTSINRNMPIYLYNNNKKLIKTYNFPKTKVWGIENVNEIYKILIKNKHKYNICDGNEALKIQTYIDKILKTEK